MVQSDNATEPHLRGADGGGRAPVVILLDLLVDAACICEGVLSLDTVVCRHDGHFQYKREYGRENDTRPSSKPAVVVEQDLAEHAAREQEHEPGAGLCADKGGLSFVICHVLLL